jgi:WD40 repeat protein
MCALILVIASALPSLSPAQKALPTTWTFSAVTSASTVSYSPDGKLLAVGGNGGVQIYAAATGQPLKGLATAAGVVNCVAFSPDGKTLAVGGASTLGVLEIWNVASAKLVATLPTAATTVSSCAFSPDGATVADGGAQGSQGVVEVWNIASAHLSKSLKTTSTAISSVAFSPDGKTVADGGVNLNKGVVELWNSSTGSEISGLPIVAATVTAIAISPDGKTLAIGGTSTTSGLLQLWSLSSNSLLSTLPTTPVAISSVAFSPDGETLADSGNTYSFANEADSGTLECWSVATGTLTETTQSVVPLPQTNAIAISPDGQQLASAGMSNSERIFTVGIVNTWEVAGLSLSKSGYTGSSFRVAVPPVFSPDGSTIVASGVGLISGTLNVWNSETGMWIAALGPPGGGAGVTCAYSPDGKTIAIGFSNGDGAVQVWDASNSTLIETLDTGAYWISSVQFSPDGSKLALGGATSSFDGLVEVWDLSTGVQLSSMKTSADNGILAVAFSPDGSILASGGSSANGNPLVIKGVVELWKVSTGALISALRTAATDTMAIAFSPDGKTLAAAGAKSNGGIVELWTVATKGLASTLPLAAGSGNVTGIAFTPNGRALFAASGQTVGIQAFSTNNYGLLGYFSNPAQSLAISPDGDLIAIVTSDNSLAESPMPNLKFSGIASLTVSPASVAGGTSTSGTVTLFSPAPAGGAVVRLAGNNHAITPPTSVVVPAGKISADFTIRTVAVSVQLAATVTATWDSGSQTANLTVQAPQFQSLTINPASVAGGKSAIGTVRISSPAPVGGMTVTLSSSISSAKVPATVKIDAGMTSATFTIRTSKSTSKVSAVISAVCAGTTQTETLIISS